MTRIFLLSPASATGRRARLLFSERATFPLAQRLRTPDGVELGAVFSFLSGLYFRGKLAYATAFATPPPDVPGVLVITPSRGLLLPESRVMLADLGEFATVPVDLRDARYRLPFE
ncbi:MAG: hypothetical protein HY561_05615, partial [Gemmatimonadetes bacterium]|nr:hypothetical protein [Gemmatimonadota bacterium]